jgi:uncharacterized membrane protein (UPF0127 family)
MKNTLYMFGLGLGLCFLLSSLWVLIYQPDLKSRFLDWLNPIVGNTTNNTPLTKTRQDNLPDDSSPTQTNKQNQSHNIGGLKFSTLELADTPATRARGYMYRENICDDCGMVFVFEQVQPKEQGFWMKNTPTSLDMIFVQEDGEIIQIFEKTTPLSTQTYNPTKPYKFVFEFKAGYTQKQNIQVGQKLDIPAILKHTVPYQNI